MITDPIGDMLTRIRNANTALHESVAMPMSGMKREIARILKEEGYIDDWVISKGDTHDTLTVTLRYGPSRERVISGLKRVPSPAGACTRRRTARTACWAAWASPSCRRPRAS